MLNAAALSLVAAAARPRAGMSPSQPQIGHSAAACPGSNDGERDGRLCAVLFWPMWQI